MACVLRGIFCLSTLSLYLVVGCDALPTHGPRPDLVAKLSSGELKEAYASWWGFDAIDSTAILQRAIDSGASKLIIDKVAGPWIVRPLFCRSNQTIVFEEGVEVLAKRGEFKSITDCLFSCRSKTNVTMRGYGATLRMHVGDYTNSTLYAHSEWRHAIDISGSTNVTIEGLNLLESGGDGVYLGTTGVGGECRNIVIRDVLSARNNRQGVSVISVDGLLLENCTLRDTRGTRPMAGLDIEPNHTTDVLRNIVVRNCVAEGNGECGFEIVTFNLDYTSKPVSIRFENCRSENNGNGTRLIRPANAYRGYRGTIDFVDCVFADTTGSQDWYLIQPGCRASFDATFRRCRVADPSNPGTLKPLVGGWMHANPVCGTDGKGIEFLALDSKRLAGYRADDKTPGGMSRTSSVTSRGVAKYFFQAEKSVPVVIAVRTKGYGRCKADKTVPVEIRTLEGRSLLKTELSMTGDDLNTHGEIRFEAPSAGFYALQIRSRGHWEVEMSSVPLAICGGNDWREPSFHGGVGDLWFRVSDEDRPFAFCLSGGGGREMISADLYDPDGVCVWKAENVGESALYVSSAKVQTGLWRVSLKRPTQGILDDYSLDLIGVPLHFFLSPDKTWSR